MNAGVQHVTKDARRRALVVEDELPVRDLLRLHLELAGFEVEESADGREALRRLRESAYNLVILDVMLPGPGRSLAVPRDPDGRTERQHPNPDADRARHGI